MPSHNLVPSVANTLAQTLLAQPHLEFAVLVGSRATGSARDDSDWDIALQWSPQLDWLSALGLTETLRRALAGVLQVAPDAIDLIEMRRVNLAMRASVAEAGLPLLGQDSLAWAHFLQRTWHKPKPSSSKGVRSRRWNRAVCCMPCKYALKTPLSKPSSGSKRAINRFLCPATMPFVP